MHHRDDPERPYRRHRDHGWDHRDRQDRLRDHGSRGHRAGRRPASASCPGSGGASHPDVDRPYRRGGASGSRYRLRSRPDGRERHRARQDGAPGDERPCPATTRTGCCRAAGCQDDGSRHRGPQVRFRDAVPAGAEREQARAEDQRTTSPGAKPRRRAARSARPREQPERPERRPAQERRAPEPVRRTPPRDRTAGQV